MIGELEDPRKAFGQAICALAQDNEEVVLLSADSGKSSGFGDFITMHPERYFEFGIMEQAVVGIASGFATAGKIPVFCAIAPFVTARPYEMFRNDLGYMRQNVKIVGRNGGITYSDLGSTHHSLDDFGIIRMIPDVVILSPQDPGEIRAACKAMLNYVGPCYMRIGNEKIPNLFEEGEFVIGKGRMIRTGEDLTIISTGSMTKSVITAAQELQKAGISAEVIGMPTICPLDEDIIIRSAEKTGRVVTVEEHYAYGGLGTMVSDLLCRRHPVPVKKLAIPNEYATSGPYDRVLAHYGLDSDGIFRSVCDFLS